MLAGVANSLDRSQPAWSITITMNLSAWRWATSAKNNDIACAFTQGNTRLSITPSCGLTAEGIEVLALQLSAHRRARGVWRPTTHRRAEQPESRPSSCNIKRTARPCSAWRATSWRTWRPSFFKGDLGCNVSLGMPEPRGHLAPTMTVKQPVNRRWRYRLAHLRLVRLLNLGHRQHPACLRALDERRQQILLLFCAEVLMVSAASTSNVKDGITLLGPSRVHHMHCGCRPAQQLPNMSSRTAQRGPDQHALNALVLSVAIGLLEPLCQTRHRHLVTNDQTLHLRLHEARGTG